MLESILRIFFGNIFALIGWFIIVGGIFALFSNAGVGVGIIIFGILLISISSALKR